MPSEKFNFTGSLGHKLTAKIDRPDRQILAYALFAHCFTCGKDLRSAKEISRQLNELGIAVMRFDFTGLGQSEGDFSQTTFSSNVADIEQAAMAMDKKSIAPQILIGHSFGGTAILKAAHQIPSADGVITIGSPADTDHILHLFGGTEDDIIEEGSCQVKIGGRPFTISADFIKDVRKSSMSEAIHQLDQSLLILHSPIDGIVGIDNAKKIFQQATHSKSYISLDDADHLLSKKQDADYLSRLIAAWSSKFLTTNPQEK